ncbi:hypothetical protein F4782DRAFT_533202 [Xylaria castorea]|nr:hypothetical protein F4782DRAFT_533202 [Xylaria castorea]
MATSFSMSRTSSIKGDFSDIEVKMAGEATGSRVATIDGEYLVTMRRAIGGHWTCVVIVAPNVDRTLEAAMCVCLDERQH